MNTNTTTGDNQTPYVLSRIEREELAQVSDAPIPWAQMERLYKLARAYGHEWAGVIRDDMRRYDAFAQAWSLRRIAEAVYVARAGDIDSIPGLECPNNPDEFGIITHTTGGQRASWSVWPDGTTMLVVHRPQGLCLKAVVKPDDEPRTYEYVRGRALLTYPVVRVESFDVPHYERHIVALFDLLSPVVGGSAAAKAVAPLFVGLTARYVPDEERGKY